MSDQTDEDRAREAFTKAWKQVHGDLSISVATPNEYALFLAGRASAEAEVERLKTDAAEHVQAYDDFMARRNKWANENSTEWALGAYDSVISTLRALNPEKANG